MNVEDAEQAFVGGCLAFPERFGPLSGLLRPEDLITPLARDVWLALQHLHSTGIKADVVTVADMARRDKADVLGLQLNGLPPKASHATIIRRESFRRRLRHLMADFGERAVDTATNPDDLASELVDILGTAQRSMLHTEPEHQPVHDLVNLSGSMAPWVVPGLLRKDWRVVIVSSEGRGKSVLLRQIAMLSAQGLHPLFPSKRTPPIRSLIVDLENPAAAIAETGKRMVHRLLEVPGYDGDRCHIWHRPGGVDLRTVVGAGALEREVADYRPDLVVLGPLYKATTQRSKESYEEAATGVQAVLDDLRTRYGFALLLEHHAPQEEAYGKRRMRPYGSSLWLRWPELGLGIENDLTFSRWRGDRLASSWPTALTQSAFWPFEGEWKEGFRTDEEEMF